jgi:S-adenosylmethionine decarboxylase
LKQQLGRQVLAELSFCERQALDDAALLERALRMAAEAAGATLISVHVHRFQPYGVSGVAILAESHLAIHTWPEMGYAAVDAFTCGEHVDPRRAVSVLERSLLSQQATVTEMSRGLTTSLPLPDRPSDLPLPQISAP